MAFHIHVYIGADEKPKRAPSFLRSWFDNVYKSVKQEIPKLEDMDINVILVGDDLMKQLNKTYRKLNKTTDVLSFRYDKSEYEKHPEAEIFIALPQAQVQARAHGKTLASEIGRLAIHGFLHVHGYDHQKTSERIAMRKLEASISLVAQQGKLW